MEERLFLGRSPVIFANIFLQPEHSKLALLLPEPRCGARKIRQDKERREGYYDRDDALEDEDPSPCA